MSERFNPEKVATLSDKTKVTFAVLIPLLALTSWLTVVWYQGTANATSAGKVETRQDRLDEKFEALRGDVIEIKTQVHEINRKMDRRR